jgi:hypothetical protein
LRGGRADSENNPPQVKTTCGGLIYQADFIDT